MIAKKSILVVVSYIVITFAIAYPWHFIWFKDLLHELGMYNRPEPIMPLGILALLTQGAVLAYLYPRFYRGGHPVAQGIKYGLIMGVFLFSISTFANTAKIQVSSITEFILIQAAFHSLQFLIVGVAIGLIFGRLDQTQNSH